MNRWEGLVAAVAAIATSFLISFVIHSPSSVPNVYSDITGSFWGSQGGRCWLTSGTLPYIPVSTPSCDYAFEYPVLSGFLLYGARLFSGDYVSLYESVSAMSLVAGVVVAAGAWAVARRMGRRLEPLYFIMPSFIIYGIYNFDIFHAAFVVLSLLSFMSGKRTLSAVFLGLGVDTKLASVVLAPVFLMEIGSGASEGGFWNGKAFRTLGINAGRVKYLAVFVLTIAAFNLPLALLNWKNFLEGYQFVSNFGLENAWFVWIFQNQNTWGLAKIFGLGIMGLLLLRIYTLRLGVVAKSALAIGAYLLGTYIYSPQLNILLLPLLAILEVRHPSLYLWDGLNALVILTWFVTPSFILGGPCPPPSTSCPTLAGSWAQLFALLRSGCLAWMCVSIASREGHSLTGWLAGRFRRPRTSSP